MNPSRTGLGSNLASGVKDLSCGTACHYSYTRGAPARKFYRFQYRHSGQPCGQVLQVQALRRTAPPTRSMHRDESSGKITAAGADDMNGWSYTSSPATFLHGLNKNKFACSLVVPREKISGRLFLSYGRFGAACCTNLLLQSWSKKNLSESCKLPINTEYSSSISVTCTS
jgi:hypothetical protein